MLGALAVSAASLGLLAARRGDRSRRRRAVTRRRAVAWLLEGAPLALGAHVACLVSLRFGWGNAFPATEPLRLFLPGLLTLGGGLSAVGCALILRAGRLEARGRSAPSRRLARLGGRTSFVGAVALAPLLGASAALGSMAPVAVPIAAAGLLACAGVIGLLGGLSAKPRPSGLFATAFHVAATGLLAWAA
jgi:hypothetical protein